VVRIIYWFPWFKVVPPPKAGNNTGDPEKATSDVAWKASRPPEALATKSHVQLATWEGRWPVTNTLRVHLWCISFRVFGVFGYWKFCLILFGHFVGMLIFRDIDISLVLFGCFGIFLDASGWLSRTGRVYNWEKSEMYGDTIWYSMYDTYMIHIWYTYDTIMIQWYSCICIILADMARIGKESQQLELADIAAISRCRRQVQLSAEAMAQSYWILAELRVAGWNINCHLQSSWNFQGIAEIAGYFMNLYDIVNSRRGDGSKPWYLVNPKIAGKWMFIPLKMYL
jgi:hypothetical protein